MRMRARWAVGGMVAVAALTCGATVAQAKPHLRAFKLPSAYNTGGAIVAGPHHAIWFKALHRRTGDDHLARMTPRGKFRFFKPPRKTFLGTSSNDGIVATRSAVWLTGYGRRGDVILRVAPDGTSRSYRPRNGRTSTPHLALGLNGELWYVQGSQLRQLTDTGDDTLLAENDAFGLIWWTAHGSDGSLWLQETRVNASGWKLSSTAAALGTGYQIELPAATASCSRRVDRRGCRPSQGAVGADGAYWLPFNATSRRTTIARFDANGGFSTHRITWPYRRSLYWAGAGVSSGPDGALWVSDYSRGLARVADDGDVSFFRLSKRDRRRVGGGFENTSAITMADGRLWYLTGGGIVRVSF